MLEKSFEAYVNLASRNEDLKSEERVLSAALDNLRAIKALLIEKEIEFCVADQELRISAAGQLGLKDSLRDRCTALIDHLFHYKCIIECLSGDILTMDINLINDDEYIKLILMVRDVELAIIQAIKVNQQRKEQLVNMVHDEEAQSYHYEIEQKWRSEHQNRRELVSKLILDLNQVIVDKTTNNLEQQQVLLNQRYQSINNLIKLSYNQYQDNNNNNNDAINKNRA